MVLLVSVVVPCTVALHGGVAGAPVAAQVAAASFMPATTTRDRMCVCVSPRNPAAPGRLSDQVLGNAKRVTARSGIGSQAVVELTVFQKSNCCAGTEVKSRDTIRRIGIGDGCVERGYARKQDSCGWIGLVRLSDPEHRAADQHQQMCR